MDFSQNNSTEGPENQEDEAERIAYENELDQILEDAVQCQQVKNPDLSSIRRMVDILPEAIFYTFAWPLHGNPDEFDFLSISKENEPNQFIPVFTKNEYAMRFIEVYDYDLSEDDIVQVQLGILLETSDPSYCLAINPHSPPSMEMEIGQILRALE